MLLVTYEALDTGSQVHDCTINLRGGSWRKEKKNQELEHGVRFKF